MRPSRGIQKLSNSRYRVQIRRDGFTTQSAYFKSQNEAQQWRKERLAAIELGLDAAKQSKADSKTLAALIDEYVTQFDVHPRSSSYRHLNWWREKLGRRKLSTIKPADIAEELRRLALCDKRHGGSVVTVRAGERLSPATINRYHAALSKVLNVATNKWHYLDSNPARKIERNRENNERNRWLNNDERERLIAACKESQWSGLIILVQLALCTVARRGELMHLKWNDIRFDEGIAYAELKSTKNRQSRTLLVVGDALRELKWWRGLRNSVTGLVFPSPNHPWKIFGNLDFRWKVALDKAGIEDFRFHDLRHTSASYLTQAGIPAITVAAILGHKTLQMTKRYSHLAVEHQRAAVTKVFGQ